MAIEYMANFGSLMGDSCSMGTGAMMGMGLFYILLVLFLLFANIALILWILKMLDGRTGSKK